MPMQSINLVPGVNAQRTLAANEAGVSVNNLIRYKEGMVQKYGGWKNYYPFPVSTSPVRDIHAFQGLQGVKYVGVGALANLVVISCGILRDITPQYQTTSPTINLTVANASNIIKVTDTAALVSSYAAVRFDVPVNVGGILLPAATAYAIQTVIGTSAYTIIASSQASSAAVTSSGITPTFTTTAGSASVQVTFTNVNNYYQQISGLFYPFGATESSGITGATSVGGITINGPYQVIGSSGTGSFNIGAPVAASSAGSATANSTLLALHYYIALGPPPAGAGYGTGIYSSGPYGIGIPSGISSGIALVATDWILDNWGNVLVACPRGGGIYTWSADSGLFTAQIVPSAPLYNFGAFVSQPQQIMMAWGSIQQTGQQDPLIVRWSDSGNFGNWVVAPNTFAGSFHIPTGSTLMGGLQAPLYGVVWTDIDVWIIQYIGQPLIWSFTRVGTGCGLIGPHAADVNSGFVYWAGTSNFFMLGPNGVQVLPCSVWDTFFQQLDTANQSKIRCASNSMFNEIAWFYPVVGGTGENTNYVKVHIEGSEFEWDSGTLSRTAWVDVTALGPPIGADNTGTLVQHDIPGAFDAGGTPINAFIETGWFSIADGNELAFVDWLIPDMLWQTVGGRSAGAPGPGTSAVISITLFAIDYPGDLQRSYGPYTVTQANQYINTRLRGRMMRVRIESNDLGSFWRLGRIRFRWAPAGRR